MSENQWNDALYFVADVSCQVSIKLEGELVEQIRSVCDLRAEAFSTFWKAHIRIKFGAFLNAC